MEIRRLLVLISIALYLKLSSHLQHNDACAVCRYSPFPSAGNIIKGAVYQGDGPGEREQLFRCLLRLTVAYFDNVVFGGDPRHPSSA